MFHTYRKVLVIAGIVFCLFSSVFAYSGGSGEPNDPYRIATVSDWQQLKNTSSDWNKNFIMTADVNLQGVALTPVGNSTNKFTGVFDGNSYIIRNANINMPGSDNVGLFGYVGSSGQIRNLGVEGINITGGYCAGGLVGYTYQGTITACYATGTVNGSISAGGLVGYNSGDSNITTCYATCTVTGNSSVGGLVGVNYGSISNCYSTGAVSGTLYYVGGLVGYNGGSIINCYSTGAVSGFSNVGGLLGYNEGCSITTSFWDVNTSGQATSDGGEGKTTAEMQDINIFFNAGWDFVNTWKMCTCGADYPRLRWQCPAYLYSGGSGTTEDPYQIATKADLLVLAADANDYSKAFVLVNDINLAGLTFATAVIARDTDLSPGGFDGAPFTGVFDGNGHSILNLTIDANETGNASIGLFGCIGQGGIVKNLGIEEMTIIHIVGSSDFVGGLCGRNYYGSITNCYSTGSLAGNYYEAGGLCGENYHGTITDSFSSAAVTGNYQTGGLCGFNMFGSIINCYSTGNVSGNYTTGGLCGENYDSNISDCFSTGKVTGNNGTGGLAGENDFGNIINCYSTGEVNGGDFSGGLCGHNFDSISNCYATGSVTGNDYTGGLCGYTQSNINISNCYATGSITGNMFTGGLCGYSISAIIYCYSTGPVTGYDEVGGLCGRNDSTISNCYSTGSTTGNGCVGGLCGKNGYIIINCYSVGSTAGFYETGGLVGRNYGNIGNCYSMGAVNCSSYVGGLVGYGPGSVSASFWDVNTSGWTTSAGGEGKTTTEMQTLSTFTSAGWDFSYTDGDKADWFIQIDEYPILTWQISPADIYTDGRNNFRDFAIFAQYWMREDCAIYNYYCDWADLDFDGSVDVDDLIEFMSYWLESGIYE
jgi:hypothetical protein